MTRAKDSMPREDVGEAEGVLFDNDGDIPAIAAAISAQGEQ